MRHHLMILPAVVLTACTFLPLMQDTPPPEFYPLPPSRTFPLATPPEEPTPSPAPAPTRKAKRSTPPASSVPVQSTDDSTPVANPCTGIVGEDVKDTVKLKLDCLKDNL